MSLKNPGAVLLVDDDLIHHEIVESALAKYNFSSVLHAYNGEQARTFLEKNSDDICLILSDLHMPGADGVELLLMLNEMNCTAPVILISGASHEILHSASQLGQAHGVKVIEAISKPIEFKEFDNVLAKALGSQEAC